MPIGPRTISALRYERDLAEVVHPHVLLTTTAPTAHSNSRQLPLFVCSVCSSLLARLTTTQAHGLPPTDCPTRRPTDRPTDLLTDRRNMATLDQLPTDVLRSIIDWLDPTEDADLAALLNLMRVSSTMWESAARRLYAELVLDEKQVVALIVGSSPSPSAGQPLSDQSDQSAQAPQAPVALCRRTRTALSFTHSLTVLGPWSQSVLDMVWGTTTRECPLFPNVQQVVFDLKKRDRPRYDPFLPSREQGTFVFNEVDACILSDQNVHALFQLPAQKYRSITCHEVSVRHLLSHFLRDEKGLNSGPNSGPWQAFQSDSETTLRETACDIEFLATRNFPARWIPKVPLFPLQIHLKDGVRFGNEMVAFYDSRQSDWINVFSHCTDIVQVHHYPRDGAGAPPCMLCGTCGPFAKAYI